MQTVIYHCWLFKGIIFKTKLHFISCKIRCYEKWKKLPIFHGLPKIFKFHLYSYDTFLPICNKSKITIVLSILHSSYDEDYICGILWHQNLCNGSYKDIYTNKPMIYTINMSTCCWFTKSYLACALNYL